MIRGNLRERDHLQDSGVEGWIILSWRCSTCDVRACDWIDVAQNRDRRRAFVNAVMNLTIPQNAGNFLTSWKLICFSRRTLLLGVSIMFQNTVLLSTYTSFQQLVTWKTFTRIVYDRVLIWYLNKTQRGRISLTLKNLHFATPWTCLSRHSLKKANLVKLPLCDPWMHKGMWKHRSLHS